jgi:hypothetical protein
MIQRKLQYTRAHFPLRVSGYPCDLTSPVSLPREKNKHTAQKIHRKGCKFSNFYVKLKVFQRYGTPEDKI